MKYYTIPSSYIKVPIEHEHYAFAQLLAHPDFGISIAEDEELVRLAAQSGCRGLFIGFESLSRQSLESWKKFGNKRVDYLEVVKKLHQAGIGVFAGFIFGSDNDGPDVFANTLDFLLEANIEVLQATRLTPFPGTPLFEQLDREGRIFDRDWSHYDFFHVVHQPLNMSVGELHNGTAWVQQQFYRTDRIIRRVRIASGYLRPGTIMRALLPLNLGYRHKLAAYESLQKKLSVEPKAG